MRKSNRRFRPSNVYQAVEATIQYRSIAKYVGTSIYQYAYIRNPGSCRLTTDKQLTSLQQPSISGASVSKHQGGLCAEEMQGYHAANPLLILMDT
eukprot:scaffold5024_cov186-Skeletonema_marinoi.AAC.4